MRKRKVTIDDLARMVQRGFDGVDKELKGFRGDVNERFAKMEKLILADHK